jgi:hypothetical protein
MEPFRFRRLPKWLQIVDRTADLDDCKLWGVLSLQKSLGTLGNLRTVSCTRVTCFFAGLYLESSRLNVSPWRIARLLRSGFLRRPKFMHQSELNQWQTLIPSHFLETFSILGLNTTTCLMTTIEIWHGQYELELLREYQRIFCPPENSAMVST